MKPRSDLNWDEVQNDPDNWVYIPEFGVRPADVNFQGFRCPIIEPSTNDYEVRRPIVQALRLVRSEARRQYVSLKTLMATYDNLDENNDKFFLASFTEAEIVAVRYVWFMADIAHAIVNNRPGSDASYLGLALALGNIADMVARNPLDPQYLRAARSEIAKAGGKARHGINNEARQWVKSEWEKYRVDYDNNKSEFARHYMALVRQKFDRKGFPLSITDKTIREIWLSDTPAAGKKA